MGHIPMNVPINEVNRTSSFQTQSIISRNFILTKCLFEKVYLQLFISNTIICFFVLSFDRFLIVSNYSYVTFPILVKYLQNA